MSQFVKRIPVGRAGEVNELVNLAIYLLSDYSSWLNGQVSSKQKKINKSKKLKKTKHTHTQPTN
jgi:hypothetical protein